MHVYDGISMSVELASAANHPVAPKEQMLRGGEINMLTGALRMMPNKVRSTLRNRLVHDSVPIETNGAEWLPEAYGFQSIVYGSESLPGFILKVSRVARNFEEELARAKEGVRLLGAYATEQTAQTSILILSQMSGRRLPAVGLLQERVQGESLFEGGLDMALPAELARLQYANEEMMQEQGRLIDLDGQGNVLVTSEGHVRVVDVGLSRVDSLQNNPRLSASLSVLRDAVHMPQAA